MKLPIKIIALLLTAISMSAMATDPIKKNSAVKLLPTQESKKIKLLYVNSYEKQIKVTLMDVNRIISKSKIKNDLSVGGFVKYYDLSKLPIGNYWMQVSDSGMTIKYHIKVTKEKAWASDWNQYLPMGEVIASK